MNLASPMSSTTPRKSLSSSPLLRLKRRNTRPVFPSPPLLILLILRIFNAYTTITFFQPDEYYQSLEVAWTHVFGYGETTWEWTNAIRGYLYPALFALSWWICKVFGV